MVGVRNATDTAAIKARFLEMTICKAFDTVSLGKPALRAGKSHQSCLRNVGFASNAHRQIFVQYLLVHVISSHNFLLGFGLLIEGGEEPPLCGEEVIPLLFALSSGLHDSLKVDYVTSITVLGLVQDRTRGQFESEHRGWSAAS